MNFYKNSMWTKFKELLFVPIQFIFLLFIITNYLNELKS